MSGLALWVFPDRMKALSLVRPLTRTVLRVHWVPKDRLCLWLLCWERNISTWKKTLMF